VEDVQFDIYVSVILSGMALNGIAGLKGFKVCG